MPGSARQYNGSTVYDSVLIPNHAYPYETMKTGIDSRLYRDDPSAVQSSEYPKNGSTAARLKFLVNYAVLAPSRYNSQPWLFRISGDELLIYADRSRALPHVDPDDRELIISCGAALHHIVVAMQHFGHSPEVHTFPAVSAEDCLASIRLGGPYEPTDEDEEMFAAITNRRTNRAAFEPASPPESVLEQLRDTANVKGIHLHFAEKEEPRQAIAQLIAEADDIKKADPAYKRELLLWKYAHGNRRLEGAHGEKVGNSDSDQIVQAAPLFLALSTDVDTPAAWLLAGHALSCVLLRATSYELSASFVNQPVVVDELRDRLSDLVGAPYPQVVLRMGYGAPLAPSARRPIHEVMLSGPPRNSSQRSMSFSSDG